MYKILNRILQPQSLSIYQSVGKEVATNGESTTKIFDIFPLSGYIFFFASLISFCNVA